MALGFHEFLLRESKEDVIKICEKIAAGEDVDLHWDMLASHMEQVGNQLKADFIRFVIEKDVRSRPEPTSPTSARIDWQQVRYVHNLVSSGLKGFCCPDGPMAFMEYISGRSVPSLHAAVVLEGKKVNCRVPVSEKTVGAAIAGQMGVSQHLGGHVSPEQLDIDSVRLASVRDATAIQGLFTPAMRSAEAQMRAIADLIRADLSGGTPKLILKNPEPNYFFVERDIESYPSMIHRAVS